MGEELYGRKDVWIRELLQNAIDATLLRKALLGEAGYTPKISIIYDRKKRSVVVRDNGVGMSLYHVRKFFSKIGRSYYRSFELEEELRKRDASFNAISRFGVGFLSVFMVAESVEIRTADARDKDAHDGLTIFIPALMDDFYVKRHPRTYDELGTEITLHLKAELDEPIVQLVRRFILCPTVEMTVVDDGKTTHIDIHDEPSVIPNLIKKEDLGKPIETIIVSVR